MIQNSWDPTQAGYAQSQILGVMDMNAVKPDFYLDLINRYDDQYANEMDFWLNMDGGMRRSGNPAGGFHFEEDRYDRLVTVGSNISVVGSQLTFDIDPADIATLNGVSYTYVHENDLIYDPTFMTRGKVMSVTFVGATATVVVESNDNSTWNTPIAGRQYSVYSGAYPENSDGPLSRQAFWERFTYQIQVMREAASTTDLGASADLFPMQDELGRYVGHWGGVMRMQMEYRMYKYLFGTMWLGQNNSNTGAFTQSMTSGYFQNFSTSAQSVDASSGDYHQAFLDLGDLMKEQDSAANRFIGYIGSNMMPDLQASFTAEFQNINIAQLDPQTAKYVFGQDATPGLIARFDFQNIWLNGTGFSFRLNLPTYDPNMLGADRPNNYFAGTSYIFPAKMSYTGDADLTRSCTMRYLEVPSANKLAKRRVAMWQTGALAMTGATNRQLNVTDDCAAWFGFEFFGLNRCGYLFKTVGS